MKQKVKMDLKGDYSGGPMHWAQIKSPPSPHFNTVTLKGTLIWPKK